MKRPFEIRVCRYLGLEQMSLIERPDFLAYPIHLHSTAFCWLSDFLWDQRLNSLEEFIPV